MDSTINYVLHRAMTRGYADHLWLHSKHTFSFANYRNPERKNFGVICVLNDEIILGGRGFGAHPHENMEIINIPLEGELELKDSMGNNSCIGKNDIQIISAGSGIMHSEYNKDKDKVLKLLQIWLYPNKNDVEPRYQQMNLEQANLTNRLQQILSPNPDDAGVWIYQEAWFHLGVFEKNIRFGYRRRKKNNGIYVFLINGSLEVAGEELQARDGIGIWDKDVLMMSSKANNTRVLIMEVPMNK